MKKIQIILVTLILFSLSSCYQSVTIDSENQKQLTTVEMLEQIDTTVSSNHYVLPDKNGGIYVLYKTEQGEILLTNHYIYSVGAFIFLLITILIVGMVLGGIIGPLT